MKPDKVLASLLERDALKHLVEFNDEQVDFLKNLEVLSYIQNNLGKTVTSKSVIVSFRFRSKYSSKIFDMRVLKIGENTRYHARTSLNPRWYAVDVGLKGVFPGHVRGSSASIAIVDLFEELLDIDEETNRWRLED